MESNRRGEWPKLSILSLSPSPTSFSIRRITRDSMNRIGGGLTRKFVSVFKAGTFESGGGNVATNGRPGVSLRLVYGLSRKVLSRTVSRVSPTTSPLLYSRSIKGGFRFQWRLVHSARSLARSFVRTVKEKNRIKTGGKKKTVVNFIFPENNRATY